ncbi:MAG: AraC family transcriptional regulator [Flavobacteriaceae bacterium]|nr:AraC family transcriptional regulator [Flavobacteriaceae bacterium]
MNSVVFSTIIALLSHCFFSVLFLLCIKKNTPKYLCLLFVVIPIPFLGTLLGATFGFDTIIIRMLFSAASFFLIGPLLYFYCKSILCKTIQKKTLFLHSIPFLLFSILLINVAPPPAPFGDNDFVSQILQASNKVKLPKYFLTTCITLSNIFYSVLIIQLIRKSKLKVKEFYSVINYSVTLQWLQWLAVFFVLLAITSFIEKAYPGSEKAIPYVKQLGPVSSLLFVFFLSAFGFQQNVLSELCAERLSEEKSIIKAEKVHEVIPQKEEKNFNALEMKMEEYMIGEQAFLNENLRLSDVSKAMEVSTNQLSFFINSTYQKNFYKYVNDFRIAHACKLLKDETYNKYTIVAIGFESGFNSKSTFNQVFKEQTNLTPSAYRKVG